MFLNLALPNDIITLLIQARHTQLIHQSLYRYIRLQLPYDHLLITEGTETSLWDALLAEEIVTAGCLHRILEDVETDRTEPAIVRETRGSKICEFRWTYSTYITWWDFLSNITLMMMMFILLRSILHLMMTFVITFLKLFLQMMRMILILFLLPLLTPLTIPLHLLTRPDRSLLGWPPGRILIDYVIIIDIFEQGVPPPLQ